MIPPERPIRKETATASNLDANDKRRVEPTDQLRMVWQAEGINGHAAPGGGALR